MKLKAIFDEIDDNKVNFYYSFHDKKYHFATVHIDEMPESIVQNIGYHPYFTDFKLELDN